MASQHQRKDTLSASTVTVLYLQEDKGYFSNHRIICRHHLFNLVCIHFVISVLSLILSIGYRFHVIIKFFFFHIVRPPDSIFSFILLIYKK